MNKRESKSSDATRDYRKHRRARRPEMIANDWETALWQNRISSETVCVYECVYAAWSLYVFGTRSTNYGGDVF